MGTTDKSEDLQSSLTNAVTNKLEQQQYIEQLETSKEPAVISTSCRAILSGSAPEFPIRGADTPELQQLMIDLNWASKNLDMATEMINFYNQNPDSPYLREIPKTVEDAYGYKKPLPGLTERPSCYYFQSEPRGYVPVMFANPPVNCWKRFGLFYQQKRYDGILYEANKLCEQEKELSLEKQKKVLSTS